MARRDGWNPRHSRPRMTDTMSVLSADRRRLDLTWASPLRNAGRRSMSTAAQDGPVRTQSQPLCVRSGEEADRRPRCAGLSGSPGIAGGPHRGGTPTEMVRPRYSGLCGALRWGELSPPPIRQRVGRGARCSGSAVAPGHYRGSMADEVDTLLDLLEQAEAHLRTQGQVHWADWLHRDRSLIAGHDAYGLKHLLRAYGGMGSINDLVGDSDLDELLSQVYTLSTPATPRGRLRGGRVKPPRPAQSVDQQTLAPVLLTSVLETSTAPVGASDRLRLGARLGWWRCSRRRSLVGHRRLYATTVVIASAPCSGPDRRSVA